MVHYELPDTTWVLISPPEHSQKAGHSYVEHLRIVNGMSCELFSGALWRDLPERYGPWKMFFNRFNR